MQKNYLINFIASMQGDKMTIKQLRKLQTATKKAGKAAGVASKGMDRWDRSMMNVAKRALAVAPVWMLLRGAIMLVTSTIRDAIQANIAFQENMARIKTVVKASSDDIEGDMTRIRAAVLHMATKSRFSLKELSEGMYYLRTAGLSTQEALDAYSSTVATATGTTNTLKDTTRIVVGVYNTMGKSLGDTLSTEEKFIQINDALTYTYATQEVQLQELGQSYSKLAPYMSGLSDDFIDIITLLGFLNTKLLKSGRAGRLLGRTMLQLSKNTKKLASIFDITFDPNAPINFLDTLKKIHVKMGDTAKITATQSKAIQEVFATRAGVPIRLLLDNFKEFIDIIERARVGSVGFADAMSEIMMHTVSAQMARLKNIIAVLSNEFFSAASAGGDFVQVLKDMNDNLEESISSIRSLGIFIGYLTMLFTKSMGPATALVDKLKELTGVDITPMLTQPSPGGLVSSLLGADWMPSLPGYDEYAEEQNKKVDKGKAKRDQAAGFNAFQKNQVKLALNADKQEKERIRSKIKLLKTVGATELEIAKYKLKQFEASTITREEEDEILERLKLQNNVLEAQLKIRAKITNTFMKAQTDLLKAQGASELQIIQAQLIQLQNQKASLTTEAYLTRLTDIRIKQALVLADIKQKELRTQTNVALQYEKADKFERPRIRRAMELRELGKGQLRSRFSSDAYDKGIILEYWSYFTEKQQEAFGKTIQDSRDLHFKAPIKEDTLTTDMKKTLLNSEDVIKYWENWSTFGKLEVDAFAKYYRNALYGGVRPGMQISNKELQPLIPHMTAELKHDLKVTVEFDEDSLKELPSTIGKAVEDKMTEENFVDKLTHIFRNKI